FAVTSSTAPPEKRRVTVSCTPCPVTSVRAVGATSSVGSCGAAHERMIERRPKISATREPRIAQHDTTRSKLTADSEARAARAEIDPRREREDRRRRRLLRLAVFRVVDLLVRDEEAVDRDRREVAEHEADVEAVCERPRPVGLEEEDLLRLVVAI